MKFRDFTIFGKTFIIVPADVDFVLVAGNETEVHQYTTLEDIPSDQLLYDALYGETVAE